MAKKSQQPWFIKLPLLYGQLRTQIHQEYRSLRLVIADGTSFIRGALPITADDGTELDRYQIEVKLPADFPKSVPVVRETAGKIPRTPDRHVNDDGTACLFVRDETWKYWNNRSTLVDFIRGPIHQFFLGQTYYSENGVWPFGQRKHFAEGVAEYYFEELDTKSLMVVASFLQCIALHTLDRCSGVTS